MPPKTVLIATALAAASFAVPASATTLVTSLAAFRAGVGASAITSTANPGNYDTLQLNSPTTSSISLNDGAALSFSNTAAVTSAPPGGFPYLLTDGFTGELFVPQDSSGNQVSTETISFSSNVKALGFEVVPYSAAVGAPYIIINGVPFAGGPYTISVTLSNGQTSNVQLPGASFGGGTTPGFFGFYGGGVTSLTISATDPNGLGFGNFVDVAVPEPASAALVVVGLAGLLRRRRAAIA